MNSSTVCLMFLVIIGMSAGLALGGFSKPMNPPPNLPQRHGRSIVDHEARYEREVHNPPRYKTGGFKPSKPTDT